MADSYTPEERAAIAAYRGPVQHIPTRTPEEWLAEPAGPMRGSVWGHDGSGNAIKRAQVATGRRIARERKFAAAARKAERAEAPIVESDQEQAARREAEVVSLLNKGLSAAEIADRMGVTRAALKNFAARRGVSLRRRDTLVREMEKQGP